MDDARTSAILDRNSDSRISANEWYYGPEFFRRADRDRNGVAERRGVQGQATPVWDDDRDDRFDNLDMNNNGRVERGEWHGSAGRVPVARSEQGQLAQPCRSRG